MSAAYHPLIWSATNIQAFAMNINVMNNVKKPTNVVKESMDPQLWLACAGGMAKIPPLNSTVLYFPQGHAEHSGARNVCYGFGPVPSYVLCKVSAIDRMADSESDEVYAKLSLVPLKIQSYCDSDHDGDHGCDNEVRVLGYDKGKDGKPSSFAKTLTQSDANNGGGFSVPRYCAETIFPQLDYEADPPVQVISAKDVHGRIWKFRHIYRGTPRRHLLTTGWSNFVNHKKLVAGDSIVFVRADNGVIRVGIRRAKRGTGGRFLGTATDSPLYGGRLAKLQNNNEKGNRKENMESVIEAAKLAASGQAFEVVYYPRASTPEFVVKASTVKAAMKMQWCPGMRFKMAFETEDSSRISWFMGTISSVHVDDQIRWPNSPWRLLQVTWDEPELLQNVKRVNPWLVELVSSMPESLPSPYLPPTKKLRLPNPLDFSLFTMPSSIQGARHISQFGLDQYPRSNPVHPYPHGYFNVHNSTGRLPFQEGDENKSCLLTIGTNSNSPSLKKKRGNAKAEVKTTFVLFGQTIVTEIQLSETDSSDTNGSAVLQNGSVSSLSEENGPWV